MPCPQACQQGTRAICLGQTGTRGCPASCSTYWKYVAEWKSPGPAEVPFLRLKHFQDLWCPWFTPDSHVLLNAQAVPWAARAVSNWDPSLLEKLLLQTPSYTGGDTKALSPYQETRVLPGFLRGTGLQHIQQCRQETLGTWELQATCVWGKWLSLHY